MELKDIQIFSIDEQKFGVLPEGYKLKYYQVVPWGLEVIAEKRRESKLFPDGIVEGIIITYVNADGEIVARAFKE